MIATDLVVYRCANPDCPSRRLGRGQVVMRGDDRPGWRGEGLCHQCGRLTYVEVDADGGVTFTVRPRSSTCRP